MSSNILAVHTDAGRDTDKVPVFRLLLPAVWAPLSDPDFKMMYFGSTGNADVVRARAQDILMKLHDDNEKVFAKFVRDMTVNRGLSEIVDLYHSLLGFCQNSTSLLSPTTQMKRTSTSTAASSQDSASARTGMILEWFLKIRA